MAVAHGPFRLPLLQLLRGPICRFCRGHADPVADAVDTGIDRDDIAPGYEAGHDIGAFPTDARSAINLPRVSGTLP